jgi:hypothetical protein
LYSSSFQHNRNKAQNFEITGIERSQFPVLPKTIVLGKRQNR